MITPFDSPLATFSTLRPPQPLFSIIFWFEASWESGDRGWGQGEAESKLETDLKSICRELGSGPGALAGSVCNPSLGTVSSS